LLQRACAAAAVGEDVGADPVDSALWKLRLRTAEPGHHSLPGELNPPGVCGAACTAAEPCCATSAELQLLPLAASANAAVLLLTASSASADVWYAANALCVCLLGFAWWPALLLTQLRGRWRILAADAGRCCGCCSCSCRLLQEQQLRLSLHASSLISCTLCSPSVSKLQALPNEGSDSRKRATMGRSSCWSEALSLLLLARGL
jgi:hypothetical protein